MKRRLFYGLKAIVSVAAVLMGMFGVAFSNVYKWRITAVGLIIAGLIVLPSSWKEPLWGVPLWTKRLALVYSLAFIIVGVVLFFLP